MKFVSPDRLILFDLDGTLTRGISTTRWLFRKLGDEGFFRRLEEAWLAGRLAHRPLAQRVTRRLKGLRVSTVQRILLSIPRMRGIGEVVCSLKRRGYRPLLATLGYEFAAEAFARRFGFEVWRGTRIGVRAGRLTGEGLRIFSEREKALFLRDQARAAGIPLSRCVAVGDSRPDRAVFRLAGWRVAVNPDFHLEGKGDVELRGLDLRPLLGLLPPSAGGRNVA